ncbi:MAG: hypothetical protein U9R01_05195, partial [candidate division WOR-3 bacterium]|nr:hypothetical protein [candidate division WOR-3 bacterium]
SWIADAEITKSCTPEGVRSVKLMYLYRRMAPLSKGTESQNRTPIALSNALLLQKQTLYAVW